MRRVCGGLIQLAIEMKRFLMGTAILGFAAGMAVRGMADSPYGVCAHVSFDSEYRVLESTCRTAADIGFVALRTDFRADEIAPEANRFAFDRYDRILSVAEKHGLQVLPMLGYSVSWAKPARLHLEDMWLPFVSNVVARYRGRFSAVEIWNEENSGLWGETPNAADYLPLLKCSSATVKTVDPSVKVAIGGLSGVPIPYLRQIYEGGGKDAFDIMNIHPYSFPRPPEGDLDRRLDELRALMAEFGDADKEIWMTEFGWPTPEPGLDVPGLMRAGIRMALPDVAHPRVAYLDMGERGDVNPKGVLESLRGELAEAQMVFSIGVSNVLAVTDLRTRYDILVLPFAEVFPDEALDALDRFVTKGGVLVDFGCMPFSKLGRERFRIETKSIWVDKRYPRAQSFADADRQVAGFSFPKYPRAAYTFFTDGWLKPGDSFCPLMKRVKDGVDVVPAAIYRFADRKGAVLVSGYLDQNVVVASEDQQAEYAVRANLIAFAKGVKRTFWYELASAERDGRDPESHFGLCSRALRPKKSACAYTEFIRMRPSGSEQLSGLIRSKDGRRFATKWRRPDGSIVRAQWGVNCPVCYEECR